jgi:uncharacterized protein
VTQGVTLDAMPMPLRRLGEPIRWSADGQQLAIEAGASTDWFIAPDGVGLPTLTAPALVGVAPGGDYVLSARVSVEFQATFDAGALVLYAGDDCWAKLAFEYSPHGEPMVVSVVTRSLSDDANSFTVAARSVWLRIARVGAAFAFHASTDGANWRFVRHFSLGASAEPAVGFQSQSPLGGGCTATFDEIRFHSARLVDLRSGL